MTLNNQFIETKCSGVSLHWDTVKTKICNLWWRISSKPRMDVMDVSKTPCHRKLQLKFILIVVKMVLTSGYLHGGDCWERSLTILMLLPWGMHLVLPLFGCPYKGGTCSRPFSICIFFLNRAKKCCCSCGAAVQPAWFWCLWACREHACCNPDVLWGQGRQEVEQEALQKPALLLDPTDEDWKQCGWLWCA